MATSTTVRPVRQARNGWLTAAAVVLFVWGGLGLIYLPILGAGLAPLPVFVATLAIASVAAAVGLWRRREWGRVLAAGLSGLSLLLDALAAGGSAWAMARGEAVSFDPVLPVDVAAWLVVLFAVGWRWPGTTHEAH